ncbi:nucleotidyltransferase domain-containing protein, partial [Patescibacteria group bacterium]|nr:nucleotidyltransferase domain-containing protein [Patescibacteria group bacterium]
MRYKLEKIIREILIELKSRSYVEGVLLFGSCARDIKLKHNDIDLYVLVNEDWYQRNSSYRNSILVELFFNPYRRYLD